MYWRRVKGLDPTNWTRKALEECELANGKSHDGPWMSWWYKEILGERLGGCCCEVEPEADIKKYEKNQEQ